VYDEIGRQVSVDTGMPPADEYMETIYKHVQACLRVLGFHEGGIDGNWRETNAAVIRFQKEKGLVPEGKVGRKTWTAVLIELARQMNDGSLSGT